MTSPQESFAFIFNNLEPAFSEELEIIPQHIFRKAKAEEVTKIKEIIIQIGPLFISEKCLPYEVKWEKKVNGNSYSASILPDKDWRYHVIAFEGTNKEMCELAHASSLIKNHLDFGLTFTNWITPDGTGALCSDNVQNTLNYYCNYLNPLNRKPSRITKEELYSIKMYYDSIKALPRDSYLYKAIENLDTLKTIPHKSELLILGYFTIIESIITHKSKGAEDLSQRHQFANKLILLRKRFVRQLNISQYFQEGKEETIWKRLYDYRSCLAHGSNPDFSSNDFKILKDKQSVFSFIHETLKLTIITALQELELVTDLRDC